MSKPESLRVVDEDVPSFDAAFQDRLDELFKWRRDVRRFQKEAIPEALLERLLASANLAPSVGLSQPWRFVVVESAERRQAVSQNFADCNREALEDYDGEQAKLYARLKLEGLKEAPIHLAVFCDEKTIQGQGLGRKTMPETLHYSVVAAVQNLWLAARGHGIGVGWVSILEPSVITEILEVSGKWRLIAYLCLGYPAEEHLDPELERHRWESRRSVGELTYRR